ncbi:hypothetical protein J3F83DRAFT_752994 [Trichoderma novae-zelandiae]
MNKRKSVVDGEQAQPCKKLKLKPLDDVAGAQRFGTETTSSLPSSSAAPEASTSASAGASEAHDARNAPDAPASERPSKRKAADAAESSQSGERKKKRVEIDWDNFDLEAFEARGRGRSPPKYHFKWKEHNYQPPPPMTASQRAFQSAGREVQDLFAGYPPTDSEDERERNGLPSPGSSNHGGAAQDTVEVPGTQYLIPIPRPVPQPERAASRNEQNSRGRMGGDASGSGTTQASIPASPGRPSALRSLSASPPRAEDASSSRHRSNKGKSPATRSGIEKRDAPHSREKQVPPLDKRKKKKENNGQRQPTDQESSPDAKRLEGFLRSRRSSRRGGQCELWCLGDGGVATRSVHKR